VKQSENRLAASELTDKCLAALFDNQRSFFRHHVSWVGGVAPTGFVYASTGDRKSRSWWLATSSVRTQSVTVVTRVWCKRSTVGGQGQWSHCINQTVSFPSLLVARRSGGHSIMRYDRTRDGNLYLRSLKSWRRGQLNLAHGTKNEKNKVEC